jgi:streptomycin 3"-kinase
MAGRRLPDCHLLQARSDVGEWGPVTAGESGARVFRSADGTRYAKCVSIRDKLLLDQERDRVDWLSSRSVPGPRLLDWREDDRGACLLTSAVAGLPADQLTSETLHRHVTRSRAPCEISTRYP